MSSLGEVYVLNDGGEVDLDLGNYERYLDITLSRDNNITTGKIYRDVIEKEVCCTQADHFALLNFGTEKRRISWKNCPGGIMIAINAYESLMSCSIDRPPCHECYPRLDRPRLENPSRQFWRRTRPLYYRGMRDRFP